MSLYNFPWFVLTAMLITKFANAYPEYHHASSSPNRCTMPATTSTRLSSSMITQSKGVHAPDMVRVVPNANGIYADIELKCNDRSMAMFSLSTSVGTNSVTIDSTKFQQTNCYPNIFFVQRRSWRDGWGDGNTNYYEKIGTVSMQNQQRASFVLKVVCARNMNEPWYYTATTLHEMQANRVYDFYSQTSAPTFVLPTPTPTPTPASVPIMQKATGLASHRHTFGPMLNYTENVSSDIVIIGGGIASWAAAYTAKLKGMALQVTIVSPKEEFSSLSERSTAVAWFPDESFHNTSTFSQFDKEIDENHVNRFIKSSTSTKSFWTRTLNMSQWPFDENGQGGKSYDYVKTGNVYGRGHSFQSIMCKDQNPATPCGLITVNHLKKLCLSMNVTYLPGYIVTRVERSVPSGKFWRLCTDSQGCLNSRSVIFANGGNGIRDYPRKDAVLAKKHESAGVVNNGVHVDTANALSLKSAGKNKWWYLEFLQYPGGYITENWFAWGGTAPSIEQSATYDIAEAYSGRVNSILTATGRSSAAISQGLDAYGTNASAIKDTTDACAQEGHKSASWWASRAQAMYSSFVPSFSNPCHADVRSRKHLLKGSPAYKIYAGVIDGKEGFETTPETMESSQPAGTGLFAAGTSGAAGLGNNYPAPGATIGFALDSAYRAASGAVSQSNKFLQEESELSKALLDDKMNNDKKQVAVSYFAASVVAFAAGICIVSVANSLKVRQYEDIRYYLIHIHSLFMLLFLILASIGVYQLASVYGFSIFNRKGVIQPWMNHRWLGRITLTFAYLNVVLIVLAKFGMISSTEYHKATGWVVAIMILFLIWTGQRISTNAKLYSDQVFAEAWFPLVITLVFVFALFVKNVVLHKADNTLSSNKYKKVTVIIKTRDGHGKGSHENWEY